MEKKTKCAKFHLCIYSMIRYWKRNVVGKVILVIVFCLYVGTIIGMHRHIVHHLIFQNEHEPTKQNADRKQGLQETGNVSYTYNTHNPFYFLRDSFIVKEEPVKNWLKHGVSICNGNFVGYEHSFIHLQNLVIDLKFCQCTKGGEKLKDVMNQTEDKEYLNLSKGLFQLQCKEIRFPYTYDYRDHLKTWTSLITTSTIVVDNVSPTITSFTIAVMRYEYANLYHTMTDWYNTFLILMLFKQDPQNVIVLWLDGHPQSVLDYVWRQLFGNVLWLRQIKNKALFRNMIWSINGYFSLLLKHERKSVPYLEEFRTFFLHQFSVKEERNLDCSNLRFLFLWRRDYIAHPRNFLGKIERKVKNEGELESLVKERFVNGTVRGVQADNMTMKEQLEHIVSTDVLIGMHGAGLTLTLFLPKHAALVELYPSYKSVANRHFRAISRWRGIKYKYWQNNDYSNEFKDRYTYIPPDILLSLVEDVVSKICN